MSVYVLKRILAMIPTLLGITFVTYLIVEMAPGDPVATSLGGGGAPGQGTSGDEGGKDRLADAIKAKKKLLGMVKEDRSVLAWPTAVPRTDPDEEASDHYVVATPMDDAERLGEFADWPRCVVSTKDGSRLFVGTDARAIHEVDVESGEGVRTYEGHGAPVWAVAVSPDGATLASADTDGAVRVWSTSSGQEKAEPVFVDTLVRDLLFLPDGSAFLSTGDDSAIRVHDPGTGKIVRRLEGHTSRVACLEVSADSERLWSGGFDRVVREWDLRSGEEVRTLSGHNQTVTDLALSRDGNRLATACNDKNVRVYSVTADAESPPSAVPLVTITGHYKETTAVAFSSDGAVVFSGSDDETIRGWDAATGRQLVQAPIAVGKVDDLRVSPDGKTVWSVGESWRKVPPWIRYLNWLGKTVVLDFDRSFIDDEKVIDKIKEALPITLYLNAIALILIYVISIPLGVMAAVRRGSVFDGITSIILFLLYSIPSFWLATMMVMWFSSERHFNWFPSIGLHDKNAADLSYLAWLGDWGMHLLLPIIALTYAGFASLSRYMRTTMLETIQLDYVRTARAKGLSENVVIYKHALRNSLITIITLVANLLPAMIGGSVIIEYIFNIRGMGLLGFEAILQRDYPVIMAITTFSAILTLLGIMVSDLLYSVVDPRISVE